jgi:hypothetical protein
MGESESGSEESRKLENLERADGGTASLVALRIVRRGGEADARRHRRGPLSVVVFSC